MRTKAIILVLAFCLLAGCASTKETVVTRKYIPIQPSSLILTHGIEGADILIDGKFCGHITGDAQRFQLPVGDHSIVVRKKGYSEYDSIVTLTGGNQHYLVVALEPLPGTEVEERRLPHGRLEVMVDGIAINMASPVSVFIDGVPYGQIWQPTTFDLTLGPHEVRFQKGDLPEIKTDVYIHERSPYRFAVNF